MNSRRLNTAVKGIHIEDAWNNDPTTVKEEVLRFFSNKFRESDHSRPVLDGVRFRGISQHQNDLLVGAFIGEEIRAAVWDCGSEKSPGPDGLNFKFIKQFWEVLKPDINRFIHEFHANGIFPRGSNTPFIALIPKVKDPQNLNEYRPISLIGSIYKIVAKLLANRLKKVLPGIIDERQSAFLSGRHLLHSVLIANETVEEAKRQCKPCLVFKVDYERAYDSVSWAFLSYMMKRLGFCPRWMCWIEGCSHLPQFLSWSMVAPQVNSYRTEE